MKGNDDKNNSRPRSKSAVVVGEVPRLGDVLRNTDGGVENPFNRASLCAYAKANFFTESLDFLAEVDKLENVEDPRTYAEELQRIVTLYIVEDAPSQVNLSWLTREATEEVARGVIDSVQQDPSVEVTRGVLGTAKEHIFSLVEMDCYPRYVNMVIIQRQLRISKNLALWWKQDELTMRQFFTFPSPISLVDSRMHNFCSATLIAGATALSYFHHFHWLWVLIVYGFAARTLCGPRLDPQAFFVLFVLTPLVTDKLGWMEHKFQAASPKHFAQFYGLIFSTSCMVLAFLGHLNTMAIVAAVLWTFMMMAFCCNICMACYIYLAAVSCKLLPPDMCDDCTINYVCGKPNSSVGSQVSFRKETPGQQTVV